eukprot:747902-Hanusia_phi.AAC.1
MGWGGHQRVAANGGLGGRVGELGTKPGVGGIKNTTGAVIKKVPGVRILRGGEGGIRGRARENVGGGRYLATTILGLPTCLGPRKRVRCQWEWRNGRVMFQLVGVGEWSLGTNGDGKRRGGATRGEEMEGERRGAGRCGC